MDVRPVSGDNGVRKIKNTVSSPPTSENRINRKVPSGDSLLLSAGASGNVVLDSIRARIAKGYYSGADVTDDLADKLARLFDR